MNSHRIASALIVVAAAASLSTAAGCIAAPPSAEEHAAEAREALDAPSCMTISRAANGPLTDTTIRSDEPTENFGAQATFVTDDPSREVGLLRFNVENIPAGQDIVSATATLQEVGNAGAATVEAHPATAYWYESAATWSNFAGAYAPAPVASFSNGGAGYTGPVSFDLTSFVRSTYSGAASNRGLALFGGANTTWASSENADPSARPSVEVCYRPTVDPVMVGAFVRASDGGGWLAYQTSSCGIFHLYVLDDPTHPATANILNASDGTLSVPLADGTYTLGVLGTGGNTPGSTHTLEVGFADGADALVTDQPGNAVSVVSGSKLVTVSNFAFTLPSDPGYSYVDRVAVCGVYPDGYLDSYGTVTLTVAPAP
jgi:hypothetical protein